MYLDMILFLFYKRLMQRYITCLYYDECLDKAAKINGNFICGNCGRYEKTDLNIGAHEIEGVIALFRAVFQYEDEPETEN